MILREKETYGFNRWRNFRISFLKITYITNRRAERLLRQRGISGAACCQGLPVNATEKSVKEHRVPNQV